VTSWNHQVKCQDEDRYMVNQSQLSINTFIRRSNLVTHHNVLRKWTAPGKNCTREQSWKRKTNPNPWKWVFITAAKVEGKSHNKLFHVWIIVSERQATEATLLCLPLLNNQVSIKQLKCDAASASYSVPLVPLSFLAPTNCCHGKINNTQVMSLWLHSATIL